MRAPWLPLLLLLTLCARAQAQEGQPLVQNDFKLDQVVGPVLGPARVVGLGGAFTALATGIDGAPWNPSSYATRPAWELDWFEWDATAGFAPGMPLNPDFTNSGERDFTYRNFALIDAGLRLQFGELGVGAVLLSQNYVLGDDAVGRTEVNLITGHYGGGWAFFDGQLVVGLGARTAAMEMRQSDDTLVSFVGTGPEAGLLVKPSEQPWRFGIAGRLPVVSRNIEGSEDAGVQRAAGLVLPNEVRMPWQLQAGLAFQFGERPLNRRWINPREVAGERRRKLEALWLKRERQQVQRELEAQGQLGPRHWDHRPRDRAWWGREQRRRQIEEEALEQELERLHKLRRLQLESLSRKYLLVSSELILIGPTQRGVGIESFLSGIRQTSGRTLAVGARLGLETEPWAQRLKTRVGTYLEPSRFEGQRHRVHLTAGFDVRLFRWDVFGLVQPFDLRVGMAADAASRYFNYGFSLGFWH